MKLVFRERTFDILTDIFYFNIESFCDTVEIHLIS